MYENYPDDRFEAALRLAEADPAQGAEALRSIVADDAFDPDTRSEAAHRLAEVDPARAAEPCPGLAPRAPHDLAATTRAGEEQQQTAGRGIYVGRARNPESESSRLRR
jgi:hypothetical protein